MPFPDSPIETKLKQASTHTSQQSRRHRSHKPQDSEQPTKQAQSSHRLDNQSRKPSHQNHYHNMPPPPSTNHEARRYNKSRHLETPVPKYQHHRVPSLQTHKSTSKDLSHRRSGVRDTLREIIHTVKDSFALGVAAACATDMKPRRNHSQRHQRLAGQPPDRPLRPEAVKVSVAKPLNSREYIRQEVVDKEKPLSSSSLTAADRFPYLACKPHGRFTRSSRTSVESTTYLLRTSSEYSSQDKTVVASDSESWPSVVGICTVCHREDGTALDEVAGEPLCKTCLSLGFLPDPEDTQVPALCRTSTSIPTSVSRPGSGESRTYQSSPSDKRPWPKRNSSLEYSPRLASASSRLTKERALDDPASAIHPSLQKEYAECVITESIATRRKIPVPPTDIHIVKSNEDEYLPVAWRSRGLESQVVSDELLNPPMRRRANSSTTIASIWDDDDPIVFPADDGAPPMPVLPAMALPNVTAHGLASSSRPLEDVEVLRQGVNGDKANNPTIYTPRMSLAQGKAHALRKEKSGWWTKLEFENF